MERALEVCEAGCQVVEVLEVRGRPLVVPEAVFGASRESAEPFVVVVHRLLVLGVERVRRWRWERSMVLPPP